MPGRSDPLACLPDGITTQRRWRGKKQRKERRRYQQKCCRFVTDYKKTEHVTTNSDLSIT